MPGRKKNTSKSTTEKFKTIKVTKSTKEKEKSKTVKVTKSTKKATKRSQPIIEENVKRFKLSRPDVKGHLLACGQGDIGQLGQGDDIMEKARPGLVVFDKEDIANSVIDVVAGGMHNVCLTSDGSVYTFGCNDEGALGRLTEGVEGAEFKPGKVSLPKKAVAVCAGDSHSVALTEDGDVFIWGTFRDSNGCMGLVNFKQTETKPVLLLENKEIVKICSGNNHLVCLSKDGDVYTCGCAEQGQLGRVAEYFVSRGGRKGIDFILIPSTVNFKKVRGKKVKFSDVWTGSYSTYLKVQETNEILACGLNNYLQLGLDGIHIRFHPEIVDAFSGKNIKMISGGQHHTLAINQKGQVLALGRKEYGRLGLGEDCDDAKVPTVIESLSKSECSDISCGISVSYAVDTDGNVYSWGMGTNSQLGHGDEDDRYVPSQINSKGMVARKVIKVSGGGQHTVFLAYKKDS